MKRRVHVVVSGRVQGVCFRAYTQDEAIRRNVTGWVRNSPGGDVEIVAEGEETDLEPFLTWGRHGPPHPRVMGLRTVYSEPTGEFDTFDVSY
jgi:acylphosphatase